MKWFCLFMIVFNAFMFVFWFISIFIDLIIPNGYWWILLDIPMSVVTLNGLIETFKRYKTLDVE